MLSLLPCWVFLRQCQNPAPTSDEGICRDNDGRRPGDSVSIGFMLMGKMWAIVHLLWQGKEAQGQGLEGRQCWAHQHAANWVKYIVFSGLAILGFTVGSSSDPTNATGNPFPVVPVVWMPQGYIPGYAYEIHPLWILTQKLMISRDGDCPEVILVRERQHKKLH